MLSSDSDGLHAEDGPGPACEVVGEKRHRPHVDDGGSSPGGLFEFFISTTFAHLEPDAGKESDTSIFLPTMKGDAGPQHVSWKKQSTESARIRRVGIVLSAHKRIGSPVDDRCPVDWPIRDYELYGKRTGSRMRVGRICVKYRRYPRVPLFRSFPWEPPNAGSPVLILAWSGVRPAG